MNWSLPRPPLELLDLFTAYIPSPHDKFTSAGRLSRPDSPGNLVAVMGRVNIGTLVANTMVVSPHAANSGSKKPFDLVMFALLRSCIVWRTRLTKDRLLQTGATTILSPHWHWHLLF
jgi:hypothetical protein